MISENQLNYTHSESPQKSPYQSPEDSLDPFNVLDNIISIQTTLFTLRKMKTQLGFESTLKYAESHMKEIEEKNPKINRFVYEALSAIEKTKGKNSDNFGRLCDEIEEIFYKFYENLKK